MNTKAIKTLTFKKLGLVVSLLSASAAGVAAAALTATSKPNIVLLLSDDQNYRTVGYASYEGGIATQVKTPQLDKLASEGVIFDAAYDTTSICMASRAQVMTGMYEYKTGTNFQHGPLTRDKWQKSYPVLLREAGYHTGFVGKFGFAVKEKATDSTGYHHQKDLPSADFDVWHGWPAQGEYETEKNTYVKQYADKYPHVTRAVGAVSQDFIKDAVKQDKPFLLSVSFKAPHKAFKPDPFFDDVYADTVWREPDNYHETGAAHLPIQAKSGRQYLEVR